ncbi:toxin-activating lysine-acyltransferase [Nitrosomonas sp.]|uniref:toxin-activating lysine-acyltransferase n=1 Tax=Nitrosomonas sp. TaxID=42353 RepID=UPI001D2CDBEA|nr:toxin-activating lysine-acyltransferase [Nitrosomonas sp.]MBX9637907.1 toxin-activating lysine-acyltransferase [Nitrosomonas sp.]MBY0483500.1 toxin-activating lysine-acyltransferase [Nitrosomonas sp.]
MPDTAPSLPIDKTKIRLLTGINPAQALGFAVSYLMTKPAFACLQFGHWSRILVGQINRGHYLIASDSGRIVGFIGWALTTQEKGDMWLAGQGELSFEDSKAGEIMLINAWAAETNDVTKIILERLRVIGRVQKMVYFKRLYPDGRIHSGRLSVNAFVDAHIRSARSGEKSSN